MQAKGSNRVEGRASVCSQQVIRCKTPRGTTVTANSDEINEWNGINRINESSLKVHKGCTSYVELQIFLE